MTTMIKVDLEESKRLFIEFANSYINGDENDAYHIVLKRDHSLRVLENAESIVSSSALPEDVGRLALFAALFHDAGRFPQYIRYKTFLDRNSKDHGILGTIVLGKNELLRFLTPAERRLVRAAVAIHNRKDVPRGISESLRQIVQVVRDADKLDIIRVMVAHFTREPEAFPVVTLNVKDVPGAYTKEIYDDALEGNQGDYSKMIYANDFKLLLCGWVNDFVFNETRRLAHVRGLLESLMDTLPDYPEMMTLRTVVNQRLIKDF